MAYNNNNIPSAQPTHCGQYHPVELPVTFYKNMIDDDNYVKILMCPVEKGNNEIKLFFQGIQVAEGKEIHPNDIELLKELSLGHMIEKFKQNREEKQKQGDGTTYFEITQNKNISLDALKKAYFKLFK
jgi:hypothetical protein